MKNKFPWRIPIYYL